MQEYWKELTENSYLSQKEYGTVMSSEAIEIGLQKLLEISWRSAPPEILRRDNACICDGGRIPALSVVHELTCNYGLAWGKRWKSIAEDIIVFHPLPWRRRPAYPSGSNRPGNGLPE